MAIAKPTAFPRWNTTGSNRTEPTSGKKDSGWLVDEQPPSSFFNFIQHFGGLWDEWLNERMDDGRVSGGTEEDFKIQPLNSTGVNGQGGWLTLAAGDPANGDLNGGRVDIVASSGVSTGAGGRVDITAGTGGAGGGADGGAVVCNAGSGGPLGGDGGNVLINSGDAIDDAGNITLNGGLGGSLGGSVNLNGGDSSGSGPPGDVVLAGGEGSNSGGNLNMGAGNCTGSGAPGAVAVSGGDATSGTNAGGDATYAGGQAAGSDIRGGRVILNGGNGRGNKGSQIILAPSTAGASGSTLRTPENYFLADGEVAEGRNRFIKPASLESMTPPATPVAGDIYGDDNGFHWSYNGVRWECLNGTLLSQAWNSGASGPGPILTGSAAITGDFYPGVSRAVPANTLRSGTCFRGLIAVKCISRVSGSPPCQLGFYIGIAGVGAATIGSTLESLGVDETLIFEVNTVFDTVGVAYTNVYSRTHTRINSSSVTVNTDGLIVNGSGSIDLTANQNILVFGTLGTGADPSDEIELKQVWAKIT